MEQKYRLGITVDLVSGGFLWTYPSIAIACPGGARSVMYFPLGALPSGKPQKTMERSSIFNGTTHYFYGHFQIRKLSQFTRG